MENSEASISRYRSLASYEIVHWAIALTFMIVAGLLAYTSSVSPVNALLFVLVGALAGYLTNDVAITLLFWPIEAKFHGILQGFFFKRRDEFGQSLINMVTERFLNPDFFRSLIQDETVETALHGSVRAAVLEMTEKDLGTPKALIARVIADEDDREDLLDRIAAFVGDRLAQGLIEESDPETVSRTLKTAMEMAGTLDVHDLVGDERKTSVTIEAMLQGMITIESKTKLKDYVVSQIDIALDDSRKIKEVLPESALIRAQALTKTYTLNVIVPNIINLVESEDFASKTGPWIVRELKNLVEKNIEGVNVIRGCLMRRFGTYMLNEIPNLVREELFPSIAKILGQSDFRTYLEEVADRFVERLWDATLRDVKRLAPRETTEAFVEAGLEALMKNESRASLAKVISELISDNMGKQKLRDMIPGLFIPGSSQERMTRSAAERIVELLADPDMRARISRECRIWTRKGMVSFLNIELYRVKDMKYIGGAPLNDLSGAIATLTVHQLRDVGPGLVEHFPINTKLQELWSSLTNEKIREVVQGALAKEFQILINMGISVGALVAFCSFLMMLRWGSAAASSFWIMLIIGYKILKPRIVSPADQG